MDCFLLPSKKIQSDQDSLVQLGEGGGRNMGGSRRRDDAVSHPPPS